MDIAPDHQRGRDGRPGSEEKRRVEDRRRDREKQRQAEQQSIGRDPALGAHVGQAEQHRGDGGGDVDPGQQPDVVVSEEQRRRRRLEGDRRDPLAERAGEERADRDALLAPERRQRPESPKRPAQGRRSVWRRCVVAGIWITVPSIAASPGRTLRRDASIGASDAPDDISK